MTITGEQSLEVGVTGPEPANRMFIIAGAGETNVAALPSSPHTKETVVALVGPVLAVQVMTIHRNPVSTRAGQLHVGCGRGPWWRATRTGGGRRRGPAG
jgi:hypothetical protein